MTDSNEADSNGVSSQGCAGHGHSVVLPGVIGPHEVTDVGVEGAYEKET